jgi:hypothetical protein
MGQKTARLSQKPFVPRVKGRIARKQRTALYLWQRQRSSAAFSLNKIEESQHPYKMPSFFYGLSHGLKIARQLSIFAPPLGKKVAPPHRYTIWRPGFPDRR